MQPFEEEEEDLDFSLLDAPLPPAAPAAPSAAKPVSSYDRSAALARAHDRDNLYGASGEFINNITNAFQGRPVQAKDRTDLFAKQRAELASEEGRAAARAEADPSSEASAAYREMVRQAMPEVAEQMGAQFERLTPSYGATALPFMKEAWARRQRAAQLKANEEKAAREREQRLADEQSRRQFELGRDEARYRNNLDAAAITAERNAAQRTQDRAADAEAKIAEERRKASVPGLEIAPGASPGPEQAKKMADAVQAAHRMRAITRRLREIHGGTGGRPGVGTELGGAAAAEMDQLYGQLITEGKNIAALGALSGPDMGLISRIVGENPASLRANLKALFGVDNTKSALEGVDRWVGNSEEAARAAFGYRLPMARGAAKPPSTGMVRVRDGKTGRTGWAYPEDVEPGDEVLNGP